MKNKKVVIMSVNGQKTIGYTEDGEFIQVPKRKHHQVGQILDISDFKPNNRRPFAVWQSAAAVAAILLVAFMGFFYPFTTQNAEAYLSVGLNSGGIEMWVDDNDRVIDVKYHDATKDWGKINIKGQDVYQAVTILASQAQTAGLIDEVKQNFLMLNHSSLNEKMPHHLDEAKLKQSVREGIRNHHCLMIMGNHDVNFVNKANELGITASQYYVIEKSNAKGHHLTVSQLKNHHIKDALNETGTTPEEIFDMEKHMQEAGSGMHQPKHNNNDTNHTPSTHPHSMEQKHTMPSKDHMKSMDGMMGGHR